MLEKLGGFVGVCFVVGLIGAPVAMLWWPLVLHHLLWWETYERLGTSFPTQPFWLGIGVTVGIKTLLPYWSVKFAVLSTLRDRLTSWSLRARLIYAVASGAAFCGFVVWQGTLKNTPLFDSTFPVAWILLSAWLSPVIIFWRDFANHFGSSQLMIEGADWRSRVSRGFVAAVLSAGRYVMGEERPVDGNVFGTGDHPSQSDMKEAGLI